MLPNFGSLVTFFSSILMLNISYFHYRYGIVHKNIFNLSYDFSINQIYYFKTKNDYF